MAALQKLINRLLALLCLSLRVETTLSGGCSNLDFPYSAYSAYGTHLRATEKGICHATLVSVQSTVNAQAVFVRIQSNYTFVNTLKDPLDAPELTLPLPKEAIFQGFAVIAAEGHHLASELVLKSDAAVPAKCSARETLSFYHASLQGPRYRVPLKSIMAVLEPGAKVVLILDYVMQLHAKQRPGFGHVFGLQLSLPPGLSKTPDARDARQLGQPGYPVSIELMLEELGLEVEVSAATAGVTLEQSCSDCPRILKSSLLQDVDLEIALPSRGQARAHPYELTPFLTVAEHPTGQVAGAVWLPPSLEVARSRDLEVFVVVDASATMRGARLARVQQALRALLRSLPHGTRLNVLGHDPSNPLEPIFSESQELDEKIFQEVDQHLTREPASSHLSHSSGPTQVAEALLSVALEGSRPESVQLRIILITDRHPPDPKNAIQLVEASCSMDCRLFSVGLGWSASPMFVEDAAKAGRGAFSYVADRDVKLGLEKVLVSHLLDALVPTIRDVQLDWGNFIPERELANAWQVIQDPAEMNLGSRLLAVVLFSPSESECTQNRSQLKLDVRATLGGVQRQAKLLGPCGVRSTGLHTAAMALYAQENHGGLSEAAEQAAHLHQVATSATQWVLPLPEAKHAMLCDGLLLSRESPATETTSAKEPDGARSDAASPLLSTRAHATTSTPRIAEKLSVLNFEKIGSSISLRDEAVNQRGKPTEARRESPARALERTDDWFRPRSSTLSVRGFAKAGSVLSIYSGSSLNLAGMPGMRVAPGAGDAWPEDPLREEAWPLMDEDFFAGGFRERPKLPDRKPSASSLPTSELSTRDTPSSRAKKTKAFNSRLSTLDFAKLGQRLSLHGTQRSTKSPSYGRDSRLESLSLFDSMLAGASDSRRKSQGGQPGHASLSLRSQIPVSKHGDSPKLAASWSKLSAKGGVLALASQLSLRSMEKSRGKSYDSLSERLQGLGGIASPSAQPDRADAFASEAPKGTQGIGIAEVSGTPGWISLEVAGGILQGVCRFSFAGVCTEAFEKASIHWRPGRNASRKSARVYLTAVPLTTASQGILLGEVPVSAGEKASELQISLRVSGSCDLSIQSADASKDLGQKLMTSRLPDISPEASDKLIAESPESAHIAAIPEALASRQKAVREGWPTVVRPVLAKADSGHASHSAMWDPSAADSLAGCRAFLQAQTFQGYFILQQAVLASAGLSWKHFEILVSSWKPYAAGVEVAHTAFALTVLMASFQDMQASWYLVARHAEAWLQQHIAGLSLPGCRNSVACLETAGMFAVTKTKLDGENTT